MSFKDFFFWYMDSSSQRSYFPVFCLGERTRASMTDYVKV